MLSGLNDQQIAAVTTDKDTLVIACPGSGKTRVLTRKIAFELERLESKKKFVVALTYTNRAAEEIQKRVEELGIPQDQLWAGTIHSFCYQWIIKPYAGYEPTLLNGFSIIDDYKRQKTLKQIIEKHYLPLNTVINTSLNRDGNYINTDSYHNLIAREFHQNIVNKKEIDFDLLLYYSYKLLKTHSKIRSHLANIFSYFFIDEYQDTQDLQYAIIGEIIKQQESQCKVFLVGDPDQAIYDSLGGISKNLEEIKKEFNNRNIELRELPGNYRSTQRIVDFFSNFQSTNLNIQALCSYANERGLISFNTVVNKEELFIEFAKLIESNLNKGVKPNEICIIAPQWYFLTPLAKKLKSILPEVPFEAPGITPLPRNRENFWWKLSRLFLSEIKPGTSINRFRWIEEIVQEINNYTNGCLGIERLDCRRYLKIVNSIKPDETDGINYLEKAFEKFLSSLEIEINSHPVLIDQWNHFFSGIGSRYESFEFDGIPKTIDYFKNAFNPSDGIVINTCHGVKGEEFETVIAFGLLWGYVPHWSSIIRKPYNEALGASSKLLYVIGSRAKRNLHLFAETGRKTQSENAYVINHQLGQLSFEYDNTYFSQR
ncbi:ATP-dependent helicase [Neobacillus sp. FSL H8-0543]|uniref:ATP-dependent helicase n=1 Tax=Neobacillus sp. FSL H8-0543 TaxID=2954672 RepID=UPI0031589946